MERDKKKLTKKITQESMDKPWLNFEAGALSKGYDIRTRVIPICVDIEFSELKDHPLHFFQSRYKFEWESIEEFIDDIADQNDWSYKKQELDEEKENFIRFKEKNKPQNYKSKIEKELHEFNIPLYENGSFVAEIPGRKFWEIRRALIEEVEETLILAGQSLNDAFNSEIDCAAIIDDLEKRITDKKIRMLKILLTDPVLFCNIQNFDTLELSPLTRITLTMNTLIDNIFPLCQEKGCSVKVFFIPLLQIDHAVISNDYMLFRSTKLWTRKGRYKGSFALYRNDGTNKTEYSVHKRYLEKLMDNCTKIDLEIDIYDSPDDSLTMRRHKEWRRAVKDRGYSVVQLYKLYHAQIVDYVAADWRNEKSIQDSFIPSKDIPSYDDLFNAENLLDDETQKTLLPYIRETKDIFENAIDKYDSGIIRDDAGHETKHSGVMIFPSLDLGFPNNVQRLAGGFATGMLVTWKCGTPIVPIDATVNVCSSSVFELNAFDMEMNDENFIAYIENIILKGTKDMGYSFSFDSGNHFLMIAQDIESKQLYLVLHTSGRYIRYIKDDDAKYFIDNAHKLEKYNVQIHNWLAEQINRDKVTGNTYHHYYMPTDSSIAIGTYVEEPGTIVPIFSNIGKDIYMFQIGKNNWKVHLGGRDVCLVPHGWGQEIDNVGNIVVNNEDKILTIENGKNENKIYTIHSKSKIVNEGEKHIRDFEDGEAFLKKGKKMIKGNIVQTLRPIYLYCDKKKASCIL